MPKQSIITINAGEHTRNNCPVSVELDRDLKLGRNVTLIDQASDEIIPAQLDGKILSWILNDLKANKDRTYSISESETADHAGVVFAEKENAIDVRIDNRNFTTFRFSADQQRPYFYPVYGPENREVTRGEVSEVSKDHVHHRSLYVAYGEVNHVDLWSEGGNAGRVVHKKFTEKSDGPIVGKIYTENEWTDKNGNKIMSDRQNFRIYALPENASIIDLDLTFIADSGDVFFGDTKEGGIITIRVNPQMDASGSGTIENSFGGRNERETWGKKANWCDYSGFVDGTHVGIAVMDDLINPRYPTYWHVRNYGLMGSNIFGGGTFEHDKSKDGSYTLKSGDQMNFRFRVLIHSGDAKIADVATKYHDFINPPIVKF